MPSDDRPKRSWREIDGMRDRSAHRRDPRPEAGDFTPQRRDRSRRTYRAALDRAFERGALGKLVGEPGAGEGRAAELAAIRDASTTEDLSEAVDRALASGALPDDVEIWARVVDHRNIDRVRDALLRLGPLLEQQPLRRTRALRARLRYLEEVSDEEEIRRLAAELRARLPA